MKPQRIQRERSAGFYLQATSWALNGLPCIVVSRPGPWGNMFVPWKDDHGEWTVSNGGCHYKPAENTKASAIGLAVEKYREYVSPDGPQHYQGPNRPPTQADIIKALRGKNLACWCALDQPCHADVLLELANAPLGANHG